MSSDGGLEEDVVKLFLRAAAALSTVVLVASCAAASGKPSSGASAAAAASEQATQASGGASAAPLRTGERFATLRIAQPYTPAAPNGGTDEYRCFIIDPKLTKMAYLTGSQFLPQNRAIVHHAIVYRLDPSQADEARKVDAQTPGEGWTCFGDAGVQGDAGWVAHWAPGVTEALLHPNLGYPMPPGSLLVMQVHYNLLATGGKAGGSDQSAIRLRLSDGSTQMTPLQTVQMPAPIELPCTAAEHGPLCDRTAAMADVAHRFGQDVGSTEEGLVQRCDGGKVTPGPTQHCDFPIPQSATVYAVAGHMHLLGRSISIQLNPGKPDARTLLNITNYNFDNQAIVPLAQPVTVKAGDTLRVTCTHDAGLRKLLPALHGLPPRYVIWGDGTSDEMCLGLLIVGGLRAG
jgi:hypothetical protein